MLQKMNREQREVIFEGQHSHLFFAARNELRAGKYVGDRSVGEFENSRMHIGEAIARLFAQQNLRRRSVIAGPDQQIDVAVRPERLLRIATSYCPALD